MSPRIPDDPPDFVDLIRDGVEFRLGEGGALTFGEIDAMRCQYERRANHAGRELDYPISLPHLEALLAVKVAFPESTVEEWRTPREREAPKPWESWR